MLQNDSPSLELATTKELLQELMSRRNFVGVIIYSNDEHKFDQQVHKNFSVFATTDVEELKNLLGTVAGDLEERT